MQVDSVAAFHRLKALKPPSRLYHYTDRKGLVGILESGTIRASAARYLNDAQELSVAFEVARQLLGEKGPASTPEMDKLHFRIREQLQGRETDFDSFVFSTSADGGDVLSQWRGYSDAGNGYALGIEGPSLVKTLSEAGVLFILAPCEYDEEPQRALIGDIIADAEQALHKAIQDGKATDTAIYEGTAHFLIGFTIAAPIVKHRAFREEKEWRLIFPFSSLGDPDVWFRDAGRLLVPFKKVSLKGKTSRKTSIVEVVVGPTPYGFHFESRAVKALLSRTDAAGDNVRMSDIPYRDW